MRLFLLLSIVPLLALAKVTTEESPFSASETGNTSTYRTYKDNQYISSVIAMIGQNNKNERNIFFIYDYYRGMDCTPGTSVEDVAKFNGQSIKVYYFCNYSEKNKTNVVTFTPSTESGLKFLIGLFNTNNYVAIEYLGWSSYISTSGFSKAWLNAEPL